MSKGIKREKAGLLTAAGIAAMGAGEWLADPSMRGAGRLQARKLVNGQVVYYYRYTGPDGKQVRLPLGGGLSLKDARAAATSLSSRYQSGKRDGERDLRAVLESEQQEIERARLAAEAEAAAERAKVPATLGSLMDAYVAYLKAAGKPSWKEVEKAIDRNLTKPNPLIAALPADQVDVDDVMPLFHRLAEGGKMREAEKLRAYLRAAYTAARRARNDAGMYAFAGFRIRTNPLADLDVTRPQEAVEKSAQAAKERKWALSEAQLQAYWRRITAMEGARGALLRFHLLTGGQRIMQLSRITVHNLDADRKTITLMDTKGRRKRAHEHVVPLIPDAYKALEVMRGDHGDYLFTLTEGMEPAGYHNVWEAMQEVVTAMLKAEEIGKAFTPGTIRKTVETRLQSAGVSKEIRAQLLSHGLGGVQARHYETHEYDSEKRQALLTLRGLLEPRGKVVPFKKRRA